MTDFVLLNKKRYEGYQTYESGWFSYNHVIRLENYARFLKQPLTLSMFVPVGDEGGFLNPPIERLKMLPGGGNGYVMDDHEMSEYNESKSKILFGGFKTIISNNDIEFKFLNTLTLNWCKENKYFFDSFCNRTHNVEGLIKLEEITLTETALKQIGL